MNDYQNNVAVTTVDNTISILEMKLSARFTNLTKHLQVKFASLRRRQTPRKVHCVMLFRYTVAVGPFDPKKQNKQVPCVTYSHLHGVMKTLYNSTVISVKANSDFHPVVACKIV